MKKISITKLKKQLEECNADNATSELILNNVVLFNDLIADYNGGNMKYIYVLYQLNLAISKQVEAVRKSGGKLGGDSDPFESLVAELKNKSIEKR